MVSTLLPGSSARQAPVGRKRSQNLFQRRAFRPRRQSECLTEMLSQLIGAEPKPMEFLGIVQVWEMLKTIRTHRG